MKKILLCCLTFVTTTLFAQQNEDASKYASLITKEALQEKLAILASADMEGRETASPGQKKAAAYLEAQFKRIGLKPGNRDSYQQPFPVYQDMLIEKKLSVNGQSFEWDKDFSLAMQTVINGDWSFQDIVFAGYGLIDSVNKINDYAGLPVKGKIVMVLEGGTIAPVASAGNRGFGGVTTAKINAARKNVQQVC